MDGVGVLEDAELVFANDNLAEIHGYDTAGALVGQKWEDLYTVEGDGPARGPLAQARHEGDWRGTGRGRRRNGTVVPVALSLQAAEDSLVCIVRTRTGENGAGLQRQDQGGAQRYRRLIDAAPVPMCVVTADREIGHCNPAAVEALGADDRQDIVGLDPEALVHEDDRERIRRRIDAVLDEGRAAGGDDYRLRGLTGDERSAEIATIPIADAGDFAGLAIIHDVAEDRQLQELARHETLIATIEDGLYVLDENLQFAFVNDALCEMLDYPREELLGMAATELFAHEDDRQLAAELREQVVASDTNTASMEAPVVTGDGDTIQVEARCRLYPDANGGFRGTAGVLRNITERKERERELERYETIIETVQDGLYTLDGDLRFSFVNDALCEMFGYARDDLIGTPATEFFANEEERRLADEIREQAVASDTNMATIEAAVETNDGDTLQAEARYRLHPEPDGEFRGSVGVIRDITERKERERRLERQRDELDTLNRINRLLLDIMRRVFGPSSPQEIKQAVCEGVAASDLYQFAWIGEPEAGGSRLVPTASAGLDDDYIETITVTTDETATGQGPGGRAFRTGEVAVSQDVRTDPTFEPWRTAALERDIRSAAAVPLVHEETVYGILAVYTARPLGFSQQEQQDFQILGEAIGFAINASKTRQLLYAEAVTELEFELACPETSLVQAAAALDCTLSLDSYVPAGHGDWVVYLTVASDQTARFVEIVAQDDRVQTVRVITDEESERLVGLTLESSLLDTIATVGGKITTAAITHERVRLVVEVPQSTAVRSLVDQLQAAYPEVTLLARTDHERSVATDTWLDDDGPAFTERQRQVLEAAYRGGYFEWPRESTGEDIADLLDIAAPTFYAHLRKAENKLLAELFDS